MFESLVDKLNEIVIFSANSTSSLRVIVVEPSVVTTFVPAGITSKGYSEVTKLPTIIVPEALSIAIEVPFGYEPLAVFTSALPVFKLKSSLILELTL